ncbi:S8 family serine peptidase [Desulfosporosinus sp. FKB]|uniref:S8 family serine peptidase n=1 Tax=Desulfosporosinus sp. FKB TaxID=1969835 RepID=UPI000B4A0E6C|nr:S8 family serine peptidase [Desulfosporosinus sp. FKB]
MSVTLTEQNYLTPGTSQTQNQILTQLPVASSGSITSPKQVQALIPSQSIAKDSKSASSVSPPTPQIVVSLASKTDITKLAKEFKATVLRQGPLNFATLGFEKTVNIAAMTASLKKVPGVLSAQENHLHKIAAASLPALPSDPYFKDQWSVVNGDVQGAWGMGATGKGITIAIVDSGIDLNHPDLKDNIVPGYNAITQSDAPGANQDDNGHGTHVAGIAAAERNNTGIVGVAYQAKIMPIKAVNFDGDGYDDAIASGIVWAADHGAKIINLSLGSDDEAFSEVIGQAVLHAYNKGCLLVAASGNYDPSSAKNPGVTYPASDSHVLAVAATDQNNDIASYSATGPEVSLAAPGDEITSDWWSLAEGSGYADASGTSMASPFVAGEAALVWGQHPTWTRDQVVEALKAGVKDLGTPGRDNDYGYGLVDVTRAVTLAAQTEETRPSPADVTSLGGSVEAIEGSAALTLSVPAQAFAASANVSLTSVSIPQALPNEARFLTPAFDVEWGSETPKEMLALNCSDPSLEGMQDAVIYHWDGARWITLGGELQNGEINFGLFKPGIYTVGTIQAASQSVQRFAGTTAEGTAIQIAQAAFPTGADTVILAQANQFPDALAGAPLAYKLQAPILLTPSTALTPDVRSEIQRLAPKTIYLLGGPAALSAQIELELQRTYTVKRLYGYTAEGTAGAIAKELGTEGRAVIANVNHFQDTLAISAWAARQGVPILLTGADALAEDAQTSLKELKVSQTLIIGGTAVISSAVEDQLPLPQRIAGNTAYDTAAAVLQTYPPSSLKLELATGENFPDALTGAVRAALQGSMVVLVPTKSELPSSLVTLLTSWKGKQIEALGGKIALPDAVVQSVEALLQ